MLLNGIVAIAMHHVVTIVARQKPLVSFGKMMSSRFACAPIAVTLVSKSVIVP